MMVIIHNGTLWRERHILFRSELFTFLKPSLHACMSMSAQCDLHSDGTVCSSFAEK